MSLNAQIKYPPPEASPLNPNKIPETPFSVSKAAPTAIPKSNAELIETLASAANIEAAKIAAFCANGTIWDAMTLGYNPFNLNWDLVVEYGGTLGPRNILENVPNHYLRDVLMDYINTEVEEEKREHSRKAVFSDLTMYEVYEYAALIAKKRAAEEEEERKEQIIDEIVGDRPLVGRSQINQVQDQALAMDTIDVTIDMTPQPGFAARTNYNHKNVSGSVVKPRSKPTPNELELDVGNTTFAAVDRTCDQIRAMIKIFTLQGDWTVDEFRLALGHVNRAQLTAFLYKRGPKEGVHTQAYELGWEFFKRRELLGIPYAPVMERALENRAALQQRDPNRGQKRQSIGEDEHQVKHTRGAHSIDKSVSINA